MDGEYFAGKRRIFDLDLMGDSLLDHVKEQQQVEDDAELDRLLAQQGYEVKVIY